MSEQNKSNTIVNGLNEEALNQDARICSVHGKLDEEQVGYLNNTLIHYNMKVDLLNRIRVCMIPDEDDSLEYCGRQLTIFVERDGEVLE